MYCYKVTARPGVSLHTQDPLLRVRYRLGEKAVAPIGYLFVFRTVRDAEMHVLNNALTNADILLCETEELFPAPDYLTPYSDLMAISSFWKEYYTKNRDSFYGMGPNLYEPPEGTALCTSLTPLARLQSATNMEKEAGELIKEHEAGRMGRDII